MRSVWIFLISGLLAACGPSSPAPDENQAYVQKMAQQHAQDRPAPSPAAQAAPASEVVGRIETYGNSDGKTLQGYVAYPASAEGALPGVLMFHEWWGLNDNIKSMANQLAAQGYAVIAVDMYGGRVAQQPDQAQALMQEAIGKPDAIKANIQQAYGYLKDHLKAARVGTLGWCFGGSMSFEAGKILGENLGAVVIYYGFVNGRRDELTALKAPVLGLFGGQDHGISAETVTAFEQGLKALERSPQIHVYPDAGHAFANPSGENYRKADAEDAWARTTAFLREHLQR